MLLVGKGTLAEAAFLLRTILGPVMLTTIGRQGSGTGRAIAAGARTLLPALSTLRSSPAFSILAKTAVATGHPGHAPLDSGEQGGATELVTK